MKSLERLLLQLGTKAGAEYTQGVSVHMPLCNTQCWLPKGLSCVFKLALEVLQAQESMGSTQRDRSTTASVAALSTGEAPCMIFFFSLGAL